MNENLWIFDIECLKNAFLVCAYNPNTKEWKDFWLTPWKWQFKSLLEWLETKPTLVGYNSMNYDGQLINHIILNRQEFTVKSWSGASHVISKLYNFSQRVIELTSNDEYPPYSEWKMTWVKHIDLLRVYHFDNIAKRTSLKWIQYMLDWHNLQDMPIKHDDEITENQMDDILFYCHNDVESTYELFKLAKREERFELREKIGKQFGFKCTNWSDTKIGDQMNLYSYANILNIPKAKIKEYVFTEKHNKGWKGVIKLSECIPDYIHFKTEKMNTYLEMMKTIEIIPEHKGDKKKKQEKQEWPITINNTKYTVALGGLHSCETARIVEPTKYQWLIDADVASMYPTAIVKRKIYPHHLSEEWLENMEETKKVRMEHKNAGRTNLSNAFKLALNSCYGKFGDLTSWQYDVKCKYMVTLGCQFELLMLIESLEEAEIEVVSANTDGIVSLMPKSKLVTYQQICDDWEKTCNCELEFAKYKKLIQLTVNDYMAITEDKKIKKKGDFVTEGYDLNKNKSFRIIPLALEAYYLSDDKESFDIEKWLKEYLVANKRNIFDFCAGVKATKGWEFRMRSMSKHIELQNLDDDIKKKEDKIKRINLKIEDVKNGIYNRNTTKLKNEGVSDEAIIAEFSKEIDEINIEINNLKSTVDDEYQKQQKTVRYYISVDGSKLIKCHIDGRQNEVNAGKWLTTVFNKYEEKDEYNINYEFYINKINEIIEKIK